MLKIKKIIKFIVSLLKNQRELDNIKIQLAKNFFFNLRLNIKNFNRTNYHYSNLCWGSSLKAIINILKKKVFHL